MANLNQVFTIDLGDRNTFSNSNSKVKKFTMIEAEEDILALCCSLYRRNKINKKLFVPLTTLLLDDSSFSHIEDEDRKKSEDIKKYYRNKFTVLTLKEKKLSKFRKIVQSFVETDGRIVKEESLPVICKLPNFYDYDLAFDKIKQGLNLEESTLGEIRRMTVDLIPLQSVEKNTKYYKSTEYYFTTENQLYMFCIERGNPLKNIWDKIYNSSDKLKIDCYRSQIRVDDSYLFKILDVKIV